MQTNKQNKNRRPPSKRWTGAPDQQTQKWGQLQEENWLIILPEISTLPWSSQWDNTKSSSFSGRLKVVPTPMGLINPIYSTMDFSTPEARPYPIA